MNMRTGGYIPSNFATGTPGAPPRDYSQKTQTPPPANFKQPEFTAPHAHRSKSAGGGFAASLRNQFTSFMRSAQKNYNVFAESYGKAFYEAFTGNKPSYQAGPSPYPQSGRPPQNNGYTQHFGANNPLSGFMHRMQGFAHQHFGNFGAFGKMGSAGGFSAAFAQTMKPNASMAGVFHGMQNIYNTYAKPYGQSFMQSFKPNGAMHGFFQTAQNTYNSYAQNYGQAFAQAFTPKPTQTAPQEKPATQTAPQEKPTTEKPAQTSSKPSIKPEASGNEQTRPSSSYSFSYSSGPKPQPQAAKPQPAASQSAQTEGHTRPQTPPPPPPRPASTGQQSRPTGPQGQNLPRPESGPQFNQGGPRPQPFFGARPQTRPPQGTPGNPPYPDNDGPTPRPQAQTQAPRPNPSTTQSQSKPAEAKPGSLPRPENDSTNFRPQVPPRANSFPGADKPEPKKAPTQREIEIGNGNMAPNMTGQEMQSMLEGWKTKKGITNNDLATFHDLIGKLTHSDPEVRKEAKESFEIKFSTTRPDNDPAVLAAKAEGKKPPMMLKVPDITTMDDGALRTLQQQLKRNVAIENGEVTSDMSPRDAKDLLDRWNTKPLEGEKRAQVTTDDIVSLHKMMGELKSASPEQQAGIRDKMKQTLGEKMPGVEKMDNTTFDNLFKTLERTAGLAQGTAMPKMNEEEIGLLANAWKSKGLLSKGEQQNVARMLYYMQHGSPNDQAAATNDLNRQFGSKLPGLAHIQGEALGQLRGQIERNLKIADGKMVDNMKQSEVAELLKEALATEISHTELFALPKLMKMVRAPGAVGQQSRKKLEEQYNDKLPGIISMDSVTSKNLIAQIAVLKEEWDKEIEARKAQEAKNGTA